MTLGAGVCGQGSSFSDHPFTLPCNGPTLSSVDVVVVFIIILFFKSAPLSIESKSVSL